MKLKVFKNAFVSHLKSRIAENFDAYRSGDFSWTLEPENGANLREIDAPWLDLDKLQKLNEVFEREHDVNDPRDTWVLYDALRSMPPELAKDERIWATLCHVHCLPYVLARNPKIVSETDQGERAKLIANRFFLTDLNRGAERTNGLSRLWWFGHCTAQVAEQLGVSLEAALEAQLRDTGFRADTIERPEVMSSRKIRAAVLKSALREIGSDDPFWSSKNKNRDRYRPVMTKITEQASRIFFPRIEQRALEELVDSLVAEQRRIKQS